MTTTDQPCEACGAIAGEECNPPCLGVAAQADAEHSTTGTHGKNVHLASFALNFDDEPQYVRTCNINAGACTTFLDNVAQRPISEVTCKSCRKLTVNA